MIPVVLASKSPARAALLTAAGVTFEVCGAAVDETVVKTRLVGAGQGPRDIALALASEKAVATSERREGLIIGADQTMDHDGRLMDKARDIDEARRQLTLLRGRRHQLHAAVALARGGQLIWREVVTVALTMRPFSDSFLDNYLAAHGETVLSCVGGYALEGEGAQLFERIEGDYFSVLGLPLLGLLGALRAQGVIAS